MNGNETKAKDSLRRGDGFRNTSRKFFPASRNNGQKDLVLKIIMTPKEKNVSKEKTAEEIIKQLKNVQKNTTVIKIKESAIFAISLLQPLDQGKKLSSEKKTSICSQINAHK